jgi:hypothetical protein
VAPICHHHLLPPIHSYPSSSHPCSVMSAGPAAGRDARRGLPRSARSDRADRRVIREGEAGACCLARTRVQVGAHPRRRHRRARRSTPASAPTRMAIDTVLRLPLTPVRLLLATQQSLQHPTHLIFSFSGFLHQSSSCEMQASSGTSDPFVLSTGATTIEFHHRIKASSPN